jgi:hypothetical protein
LVLSPEEDIAFGHVETEEASVPVQNKQGEQRGHRWGSQEHMREVEVRVTSDHRAVGFRAQKKVKSASFGGAQRSLLATCLPAFLVSLLLSTSFSVGGLLIIWAASFRGSRCFSGMKHLGKQNV